MSGTTKPKPEPVQVNEPVREPEPVRVPIRAVEAYSNGTIPVSIGWKAGEVRYVTMGELMQLRADKAANFEVVPAKE